MIMTNGCCPPGEVAYSVRVPSPQSPGQTGPATRHYLQQAGLQGTGEKQTLGGPNFLHNYFFLKITLILSNLTSNRFFCPK